MKAITSILKVFLGLAAFGISSTEEALAQKVNPTGEERLFRKRREHANIALGLTIINFSTESMYSKDIYASQGDSYMESGVNLRGTFPVSDRLRFGLQIPYLARYGFVDVYNLGLSDLPFETEFKVNHGIGDILATLGYDALIQNSKSPFNLAFQIDAQVPTGESQYDESYEGFYALGNGFWAVIPGIGVSRGLSSRIWLFSNWSNVRRFSRTFQRYFGYYYDSVELAPDDTRSIRVGIGFFFSKDFLINFEYERTSVGAIRIDDDSSILARAFTYKTLGINLIWPSKSGLTSSIYLGVELSNNLVDTNRFIVRSVAPLGFNIFNISL